jgi:hypothetical protein
MRQARALLFVVLCLTPGPASGQSQGLQGIVEDASGQPLEAARITPLCPRAGMTASVDSARDGKFLALGQSVTPGLCKVTILKNGFETETREVRVRFGFTEDMGRIRLRRVGEPDPASAIAQPPTRPPRPEAAPITSQPGSVYVVLAVRSLAYTSVDDTDFVEAWLKPCISDHLLPLISERGWNPVYLGVVQPPDAKGLLTIDYSESLGVEYIPAGRGVNVSARLHLTDPATGTTVWNETVSASTSAMVSMRLGTSLYMNALENLREACRSLRTKLARKPV